VIYGEFTSARKAVVTVPLHGPQGRVIQVKAAIDTAFTEYLTLSPDIIEELGLPRDIDVTATMADGSEVSLASFRAIVEWDGTDRMIYVISKPGEPLIGMALIYGNRLVIDAVDGGLLMITRLV
jgi:clan AA aspartic protease